MESTKSPPGRFVQGRRNIDVSLLRTPPTSAELRLRSKRKRSSPKVTHRKTRTLANGDEQHVLTWPVGEHVCLADFIEDWCSYLNGELSVDVETKMATFEYWIEGSRAACESS